MSQSIELHGPIQEQGGIVDKARALKEKLAALARSTGSKAEEKTATQQAFEVSVDASNELYAELQKLQRIDFFSYTHINDILKAVLKNPEMMVSVRLRVMEDGLKAGKNLTEDEWGELAKKRLQDEDVQMWLSKNKN